MTIVMKDITNQSNATKAKNLPPPHTLSPIRPIGFLHSKVPVLERIRANPRHARSAFERLSVPIQLARSTSKRRRQDPRREGSREHRTSKSVMDELGNRVGEKEDLRAHLNQKGEKKNLVLPQP